MARTPNASKSVPGVPSLSWQEMAATGQVAATEIQVPHEIAKALESELYKQFDGVGKDYKGTFRSFHFSPTDSNNPDLRAQVLMGKIAPEVLVRMGPKELASSELNKR